MLARSQAQLSQSESAIGKGISILLVNDRPGVEPPSICRSLRAYGRETHRDDSTDNYFRLNRALECLPLV
jgi:hypothetical protein